MGWFSKKDKEEVHEPENFLPSLPKLPDLPQISKNDEDDDSQEIHQLPTFPSSSLGEKFSRDTIKQAVSGSQPERAFNKSWGKEEMVFEADDFAPRERTMPQNQKKQIMQPPQVMPQRKKEIIPPLRKETRHMEEDQLERSRFDLKDPEYEESDTGYRKPAPAPQPSMPARTMRTERGEPIFIRLDKFEASLKTFEKAKKQLSEIEKMLKEIEDVKKEEESQLEQWKAEIMKIKEQIQRVDSDIFSSIG